MANPLGKLTKHKFLMMSPALVSSLPHTEKFTKESFLSFLKRYDHIIVKPSNGSNGVGVTQIFSIGKGRYTVQRGKRKTTIEGAQRVYAYVKNNVKGLLLVQQGIKLAKIDGRPFDLRVMVQKQKPSTSWVVTGILAKIAGPGHFITNLVESKGTAVTLETAIRKAAIQRASYQNIKKQIDQLALQIARRLQKHYPIRGIGIDMGIDTKGKVWIIEANFSPDKSYFLRLKDKTMYRRIMKFYHGG